MINLFRRHRLTGQKFLIKHFKHFRIFLSLLYTENSRTKKWCVLTKFSPVHERPCSGDPAYPLKHLQSDTLVLPIIACPEFAGQALQ